jgi:DNA-binding MarR family transcriptional regulator
MPDSVPKLYSREIKKIVQRFFLVKNRLRVGLPENLALLKKRLMNANQGNKAEGINNFDLFYSVSSVFEHHQSPMTMGELSHELDVPLSTATRIMDWLVNNSYAERMADPQDRRIVRVALTDAGRNIYSEIDKCVVERVTYLMSQFTPDESETFLKLLEKIVEGLEKEA